MTPPPLPPAPSYDQVVSSVILLVISVIGYFTRKTHQQVKPSNGKRTAQIIEEMRGDQIIIKADLEMLRRGQTSQSQLLTKHMVEDEEGFRQLGVVRPDPKTPQRRRRND